MIATCRRLAPALRSAARAGLSRRPASAAAVRWAQRGLASDAQQPRTVGEPQSHAFQAETRQLLDILANSIYTDKEVWVRELVSNASDALEKVRHKQLASEALLDADLPLGISIRTDEARGVIEIEDSGIGMSEEDMKTCLGTIARSGSREFMAGLAEGSSDIIGRFGVGFYSVFMAAHRVEVFSRGAAPDSEGLCWTSDGSGHFDIHRAEGVSRGTRIVIHLNDDGKEFAERGRVAAVVRKYSNFVAFPIEIDGEVVNTVKALWTEPADEVTEEQHTEFYRFTAHAYDEPRYTIHFRSDAPIDMKVLLYIGKYHSETFGMERMAPGVNLYSRKVLIEGKSPDILPDWMRFVKGVVDSEDLPLSISRERMQDSRLLARLKDVLSRRVIKHLEREAKNNPQGYDEFFREFGTFLKEGVCTDAKNKDAVAKLLRFQTSTSAEGELSSLDDYVGRCTPLQDKIYYLCAPSRKVAESSPYYEAFRRNGVEVLFLYTNIDDFVMTSIGEYNGRKIVSAEAADLDPALDTAASSDVSEEANDGEEAGEDAGSSDADRLAVPLDAEPLTADEVEELSQWAAERVEQLEAIRVTERLVDSPAIIVDHQGAAMRRMLKLVERNPLAGPAAAGPYTLEVNARHPLVKGLAAKAKSDPMIAELLAEQMLDNALVAAGLLEDGREMLPRLNKLLTSLSSA